MVNSLSSTPKGLRLQIAIFGRRNVGKSSLINALTGQEISIVSEIAGTTTDPVEKPMELLPIGPVVFIDTAGLDDAGILGEKRIEKTLKIFQRADVILLVTECNKWTDFEEKILSKSIETQTPVLVVLNKTDIFKVDNEIINKLEEKKLNYKSLSVLNRKYLDEIKYGILKIIPKDWTNPPALLGDLVTEGSHIVFVVPIDLEAPKGRLIIPQVMAIRDVLDNDSFVTVVKEKELLSLLRKLKEKPKLVVCDSQVVLKVSADVPKDVKFTTFSILFSRLKGDLNEFVKGVRAVDELKDNDNILISEACTHHPIADDIGRVKIPRWIKQYTGLNLNFDVIPGIEALTENIDKYKLIVHCGGCVINRKNMLFRIFQASKNKVPITNYGILISYVQGVLERSLSPFPYALYLYNEKKSDKKI